jgi:hypothetical protein
MTELDLRITGEIQTLRLQEGDIVVVKVPEQVTQDQAERIRAFMKQKVPQHDVVVLGGGMDIVRLIADVARGKATHADVAQVMGEIETQIAAAEIEQNGTRLVTGQRSDQLRELIDLQRQTIEEIRRLRR